MRTRDPLLYVLIALSVWLIVVTIFAVDSLRGTENRLAESVSNEDDDAVVVRAGPDLDVDPIAVDIPPGSGADAIRSQLVEAGVLLDGAHYDALLGYTGIGPQLLAGRYEFPPGTPATEVLRRLRLGISNELLFGVPEGLRVEEVGALASAAGITTETEWAAAVAQPRTERLLASRPEDAALTGYLFPASYPLSDDATADDLLNAMAQAFEEAVAPLEAEIEASGLTLHEVLTLAAIVEREAVISDEQPIVASVFLNRLADGIKLDADPTVQFAISEEAETEPADGWWKRELTIDDLAFDSPYNTYLYAGLPPGPIASPGLGAILAVLRPAETDYYYFVATADGTGSHAFAETLEEHLLNVEEYRNR